MSNSIDGVGSSTPLVTGTSRGPAAGAVANPGSGTTAAASPAASDTATVSTVAQLLAKLGAAVDQSSGFDGVRVATLQAAINSGSYQVDAQAVAARLLATQNELQ